MWRLNKTTLLLAILFYSYIPLFIFLLGWVRVYFAIPTCLILLFFLCRFYFEKRKEVSDVITIHWSVIFSLSLLVLGVCILCGYGGFVNQAFDWIKHNAILQDLYTHTWPVTYTVEGKEALLIYYHGLYLPAALVGKIFNSHLITELAFLVIGYVGLLLMLFSLIYISKADIWYKQIGVCICFLAFGGLVYPLEEIINLIPSLPENTNCTLHGISFSGHALQFRSIFVMVRWVGPQCFVAWLSLVLFWHYKDDLKWYAIIIIPCLLNGTWAFLGLFLIMIYYAVYLLIKNKQNLRKLFSLNNLLPSIASGSVFVLYLAGNLIVKGDSFVNNTSGLIRYNGIEIILYLLFVIIVYGIYVILIWYYNKDDVLFYVIPLALLLIPLFSIGSPADFCMGVSIPIITLLCVYIIDTITRCKIYTFIFIILTICLGAYGPYKEMKGVIKSALYDRSISKDYSKQTLEISLAEGNDNVVVETGVIWQNYVGQNLEENIFFKYLAK